MREPMFERLKSILTGSAERGSHGGADEEQRLQIATAVILLEVAYADDEFSETERERIVEILKAQFSLENESVQELIRVSEEQMQQSIDLWHFTEIINRSYGTDEKIRVIEKVWQIIYADGKLDRFEDHIVHKLARVLNLSHRDMIEAKMKYIPEE
jgi:uncharacterized tellurite resistance protein B-like protein